MAKEKNVQLKRVNINLPSDLVDKVKEYGDSLGINTTSAYIVLLNRALEQKQSIDLLPLIFDTIKQNPQLINSINEDNSDIPTI